MKLKFFLFVFITFLMLLSCSDTPTDSEHEDDDIEFTDETTIGEDGYIGAFIQENSEFIIQKTTESEVSYPQNVNWANTGYNFSPEKNIKITAIGGMVAETGTYKFELYSGFPFSTEPVILFADSITISSTDEFQYLEVDPISLTAGGYYVLWYKNESYDSVYDLGLGYNQPDDANIFPKPFTFNEVTIDWAFYEFSSPSQSGGGEWHQGLLRGLVDFKYQIIE